MKTMLRQMLPLVAFSLSLSEVGLAQAASPAFKITMGNDTILTLDRPRSDGGLLTFHRYPDGLLASVRKSAITIVQSVASPARTEPGAPPATEPLPMSASERVLVTARKPGLQPGEVLMLGETGASSRAADLSSPATKGSGTKYVPRPGEGLPGKALFNPNRDYRPEWDSTLVPGYSIPFSNSPDDYVEGKNLPYPPGSGFQQGPGYPPVLIHDGTEAPRVLSRSGGWSPPLMGNAISPPTTADRGSDVPRVPDVHDVPRTSYDPALPPPGQNPSPPKN